MQTKTIWLVVWTTEDYETFYNAFSIERDAEEKVEQLYEEYGQEAEITEVVLD